MKIYDCFVFFNELDLLEIRLKTYYDKVDYFVLCECSKTQQGKDKPYYYEENKTRFEKFADKIIHIKADKPPILKNKRDWSIEFYQRECIEQGIRNARSNDLIIISDLDEFYSYEVLNFFKNNNNKRKASPNVNLKISKRFILKQLPNYIKALFMPVFKLINFTPITIDQNFSYFFINYSFPKNKWNGSVFTLKKNIKTIQYLRNFRNFYPVIRCQENEQLGWHFSYLGGREQIKKKLNSIIEGGYEFNLKGDINNYIDDCLENRKDLFNNRGEEYSNLDIISIEELQFPNAEEIAIEYPQFFYKTRQKKNS